MQYRIVLPQKTLMIRDDHIRSAVLSDTDVLIDLGPDLYIRIDRKLPGVEEMVYALFYRETPVSQKKLS